MYEFLDAIAFLAALLLGVTVIGFALQRLTEAIVRSVFGE